MTDKKICPMREMLLHSCTDNTHDCFWNTRKMPGQIFNCVHENWRTSTIAGYSTVGIGLLTGCHAIIKSCTSNNTHFRSQTLRVEHRQHMRQRSERERERETCQYITRTKRRNITYYNLGSNHCSEFAFHCSEMGFW